MENDEGACSTKKPTLAIEWRVRPITRVPGTVPGAGRIAPGRVEHQQDSGRKYGGYKEASGAQRRAHSGANSLHR